MKFLSGLIIFLFFFNDLLAQPGWHYYEGLGRRRNQIDIPIKDEGRIIIAFNHWRELDAHQNIDSLISLFLHDNSLLKDSSFLTSDTKKIFYSINKNGKRNLIPFSYKKETKQIFSFKGDSISIFTLPTDTLIIEKEISTENKWGLPQNIRIYLLLKDFKNIEKHKEWNLKEKIDKARIMSSTYKEKNIYKQWYKGNVTLNPAYLYPIRSGGGYYSEKAKVFKLSTGGGLRPNQLFTTLSGEITVLPLMTRVGLRTNFEEYFFAGQGSNNFWKFQSYSFVNVGMVLFQRWPKTGNSLHSPNEINSLSLGYLVRNGGNNFANNTWRLSSRVKVSRKINVEPEIYWHGFFKNVYPGIRINFSFFTNDSGDNKNGIR